MGEPNHSNTSIVFFTWKNNLLENFDQRSRPLIYVCLIDSMTSLTRYSETDKGVQVPFWHWLAKRHFYWPTESTACWLVVHIFDPLIEGIRDTYCVGDQRPDNPLQVLTQSCRQAWGDCSSNATHNYNSGLVCPPSPSNPRSTPTTSTHLLASSSIETESCFLVSSVPSKTNFFCV